MFREQFRFPFRAVRGTQSKSRAMARFLRIVSRCVATAVGRWTVIIHTYMFTVRRRRLQNSTLHAGAGVPDGTIQATTQQRQ